MGLRDLGHKITIWSIEQDSPYKWTSKNLDTASTLGFTVKLTPNWVTLPSLDSIDLIWCAYYNFVEKFVKAGIAPIICDNFDLLSIHQQINEIYKKSISNIGNKTSFRGNPGIFSYPNQTYEISTAEIDAYSHCQTVVTISKHETQRLKNHEIRTCYIPYFPEAGSNSDKLDIKTYSNKPTFCGSANIINLFAHDFLGEILIPGIRLKCPDFELDVMGDISDMCLHYPFCDYKGYLEDESEIYRPSAFGISSAIHGTGQKIKLIEWMVSGLAVVSFTAQRDDAPIISGETGFSCANLDEFYDACQILWKDRNLCQEMGRNAREAVLAMYSKEKHLADLEKCLTVSV
jgi:glycosyltransferase involved in cell wall biosynthesis